MSKHTPGPWNVNRCGDIWGPEDEHIATIHRCNADECISKANACLVIAAPTQNDVLLQLAKMIKECPRCKGDGLTPLDSKCACGYCGGIGRVLDATSLIQDIEEVIKKAKGRE